ncbi:alkaline phosphatase family protein [Phenylobacterium sp. J426]|uniref:alkaline phosphatase family protein n=1 Tax=Phenylobacterium sp. J426 TaxID=2898439 RepID=UPI00215132E8|nr:alkaline phosphatase family protein [Phenylobacterium sp. J426]MCR5873433.1 alkaline phosphatase family protein [Phenylobacterium sp. J426]
MRRIITFLAAVVALTAVALGSTARAADDRRLVLVTLDGLPWQEVFHGADRERAANRDFVHEIDDVRRRFVTPADRAAALMPFLNGVVARDGVLIGDRDHGSCAKVSNEMWFSYPGYNEILTGKPDPRIRSNEHGPNANVSFLEWVNRRPGFRGKVRALGSWDHFEDIINAGRSGVPVNDGWDDLPARTPAEARLADFARWSPRLWPTVRLDAITHGYALETLKRDKPRVLFVSYGETDDFAHEGRYDMMLDAAQRTDGYIAELWRTLQADPAYRGKTTLIVTTDHGRGEGAPDAWKHHGKPLHKGSDAIWIGAIGRGVAAGAKPEGCVSQSQIAATALTVLGEDWTAFDPQAGQPLPILTGR